MKRDQRKPSFFVSYRRSDSADVAGRLAERIRATLGPHSTFVDVNDIRLGAQFDDVIRSVIETAHTVLVLIGPRWLSEPDEFGQRRIDDPDDYVRKEIETALANDKVIIPVLVGDTQMPRAADLPASLRVLTQFNAARLRPDPDFRVSGSRAPGAGLGLGKSLRSG